MLQKQMKENGVCLFYNNSSASCLYWFIFRNNTLHLFLVPHPFKIEASLQNSLSLQCTYLCIFDISQCMDFLSCWPGSPVQLKQVLWPLKPAIPLKQISSFSTLPYVLLFNKTEKKNTVAPKCFLEIGKIVMEFIQLWNWGHFSKLSKIREFYQPTEEWVEVMYSN